MPAQRRARDQLNAGGRSGSLSQQLRQIVLQVNTHDKEIRRHNDALGPACGQALHGLLERRLGELEECLLPQREAGFGGCPTRYLSDGLVRFSNARAVGKNDERFGSQISV